MEGQGGMVCWQLVKSAASAQVSTSLNRKSRRDVLKTRCSNITSFTAR